jgi:hypothetical protein
MEERAVTPSDVLGALADLASRTEQRRTGLTVPTEWFRWLDLDGTRLLQPIIQPGGEQAYGWHATVDRDFGERLEAIDQIRSLGRPLRVGWLFVAGRQSMEAGRRRSVFHPLVQVPVRASRPPLVGDAQLVPVGDPQVTELVAEPVQRHRYETVEIGGGALDVVRSPELDARLLKRLPHLHAYAQRLAVAAGFDAGLHLVAADASPERLMRHDGLRIVVGLAVFVAGDVGGTSHASALRTWAQRPLDTTTAFHALYGPNPPAPAAIDPQRIDTPFALTPAQTEVVLRARVEPVTVVSGAPGNGKSHTVTALVGDALARGESVLVATRSEASVDALIDLFERAPGPAPVVFGSAERREQLAVQLAAGQLRPTPERALLDARDEVAHAVHLRDDQWTEVAHLLAVEAGRGLDPDEVDAARVLVPGLFDPGTELDAVTRQEATLRPAGGWWARRRRRRGRSALLGSLGAAPDLDPVAFEEAAALARHVRAASALVEAGGLELRRPMAELLRLDDGAHRSTARWLAAEARSSLRLTGPALGAVAALATALRSGRAARRSQLARMDATPTRALPLWLGTLADVEDLLPAHPGLFDLVVVDEASSIEQPLAVPAFLRGRRAVVAGDPQQLRHVSFASDDRHDEVMAAHGIDRAPILAARLDVRRNSVFDVAAGVAAVTVLDEHFRSDPHLVELVARRLYVGRLEPATRTPVSTCRDCITVDRVDGQEVEGVVPAEVAATMRHVRALHRQGAGSVGIMTPFRAQADALEAAVLAAFTADDLRAMDLRVSTVHGFQGNERDVVVLSLGVGEDGARRWPFVDDPHLFAVLATRARKRMIVVHSADPPPGGLCADYLALDDVLPAEPAPVRPPSAWTATVAAALADSGVAVRPSYPTGRHVLDLVLDDPHRAVAIECEVHPDGPDAHLERRLALERAGWDVVDAFRSRWEDRPGAMVLHLLDLLGRA